MPQPHRRGHVHFHPDTLLQQPNLGIHIGRIAAEAARIDIWLTVLVARLAGKEAIADDQSQPRTEEKITLLEQFQRTAASMHLSLSGSAAKDAVLCDLVDRNLTETDQARFRALLKQIKSIRRRRNDVIHGVWGYSPEAPDTLILQPLEHAVNYMLNPAIGPTCQQWRKKDFLNLIHDIQRLNGLLATFRPNLKSREGGQ